MSDKITLADAYEELKQEFYNIFNDNKRLSSEVRVMRETLDAIVRQDQSYPWDESEYCIGRKAGLDTAARIAKKTLHVGTKSETTPEQRR